MTATPMPREKAHQIVSSLARGRTITATADRTLVDAAIVRQVGEECGYPDLAKLADAASALTMIRPDWLLKPAAATPPAEAPHALPPTPLTRARLIPDLARHVARVDAAMAALSVAVDAYDAQAADRAETAAKRAKVAELTEQLRAAKAALRPTPQPAVGPSAATIRAWAREQGLTVPNVGRVPAAIREQYQAAHGGQP